MAGSDGGRRRELWTAEVGRSALGAERGGDAQRDFVGQRARDPDFGVALGAQIGEALQRAVVDRGGGRLALIDRPPRRRSWSARTCAVPTTVAASAALIWDSTVGVWVF